MHTLIADFAERLDTILELVIKSILKVKVNKVVNLFHSRIKLTATSPVHFHTNNLTQKNKNLFQTATYWVQAQKWYMESLRNAEIFDSSQLASHDWKILTGPTIGFALLFFWMNYCSIHLMKSIGKVADLLEKE